MLEAEQALSASLSEENAVLREGRAENGQMWLRAAHQNSDLRDALVKIKGMRTPKANGTVVRMANVAEAALDDPARPAGELK
jgi:hypothetical protein